MEQDQKVTKKNETNTNNRKLDLNSLLTEWWLNRTSEVEQLRNKI